MVAPAPPDACCTPPPGRCVFAKALLSRQASCECSAREWAGEQLHVTCTSPFARTNCASLAALFHERSRFALRLPAPGRPMLHAQALRLQCGGLAALSRLVGDGESDVHRLVMRARQRQGSFADLPWSVWVADLAAWSPRRRGRAR